MADIDVVLWNDKKIKVHAEATFHDIIKQNDTQLAKKAIAVKVNGLNKGLYDIAENGDKIEIITFDSREGKDIFFHSSSHIMAQAIQALFPGTKLAIGPAIEEGFYYDFDTDHIFTPDDFKIIEKKMKELVNNNLPFQKKDLAKEEAIKLFEQKGEIYKLELLQEIPDQKVSIYQQGDFFDLCRGPHIPSS